VRLARELLELASWSATVYCGTTVGLGDPWSMLVWWLTDNLMVANTDPSAARFTYTIHFQLVWDRTLQPHHRASSGPARARP
jgi:hypothetical protein